MSEELLKRISEDLASFRKEFTEFKAETKEAFEKLDRIDRKVGGIQEQTAKISEFHTETMYRFDGLATKRDLSYFDRKVGEHDRELYTRREENI